MGGRTKILTKMCSKAICFDCQMFWCVMIGAMTFQQRLRRFAAFERAVKTELPQLCAQDVSKGKENQLWLINY